MLTSYTELDASQQKTLKDSIAWITVLIAGADGKIEEKELAWAEKVTQIRTYAAPEDILPFFQDVGKDFSDVLKCVIEESPEDTSARNQELTEKLSQLNDIMPLFEKSYGYALYKSLTSFAQHVAKSAGGVLGFFSIGKEEAKLVDLPMLNPVG